MEVKEGILSINKETASQIEHHEDKIEYTDCNLCSANDARHLYEIDGFIGMDFLKKHAMRGADFSELRRKDTSHCSDPSLLLSGMECTRS